MAIDVTTITTLDAAVDFFNEEIAGPFVTVTGTSLPIHPIR